MIGRKPGPKLEREPLDLLGKRLGLITIIIGIFVSLNTLIGAWNRERLERHEGFRSAIRNEEEYWLKVADQYLEALAMPKGENQKAKLAVIQNLALARTPLDLDEYVSWYEGSEHATEAEERLKEMPRKLELLFSSTGTNDRGLAQNFAFSVAEETSLRARDENGRVTGEAAAQTVNEAVREKPSLGLSYAAQVLSAGSPQGWDVDVFWCVGTGAEENLKLGGAAAQLLASSANTGRPVTSGIRLGRVRLRALPESQQEPSGSLPREGNLVVADAGAGESEAARAIVSILKAAGHPFVQGKSGGRLTKYYLSVFACNGKQKPS